MSIRILILVLVLVALAIYAWRNWFVSLCGLIILTAVMGHPDMPKNIMGIQGLNPWNMLLAAILVPWYLQTRQSGIRSDLPKFAKFLFFTYVAIVIVAYLRAAIDMKSFPDRVEGGRISFSYLTSDYLVNSLKFIVPGYLLYDGCRTRKRLVMGLAASLMMAVLYAFIIVRTVPVSNLQVTGKAEMRQRHQIGKRVGFHANSAAMICASGCWGLLAAATLVKSRLRKMAVFAAAMLVAVGLALTRSRGGYVAFIAIGLLFAVFLWRYLLAVLPIAVLGIAIAFPGITQRVFAGVGVTDVTGSEAQDIDTITAGRATDIWPSVLDQIAQSPIWGYGRLGILRTPAQEDVKLRMGQADCPTHPHNAYLEVLLDGGVLSAIPMGLIFLSLTIVAIQLCRDRRDVVFRAVGGALLAAVSALVVMGMSGQTFFPKENSQMAWCIFGIGLRVWVERAKFDSQFVRFAPTTTRYA